MKLCLLAHQLKLLLKHYDPLLWRESLRIGHCATAVGPNRRPLAPILPTMLTQPYQNGLPPLDAIRRLGLLVGQFAVFNLINKLQSKRQRIISLRVLYILLHLELREFGLGCEPYSERDNRHKKARVSWALLFALPPSPGFLGRVWLYTVI